MAKRRTITSIQALIDTGQPTVTRREAALILGVDIRTLNKAILKRQVRVILLGDTILIPSRWLIDLLSGNVDGPDDAALSQMVGTGTDG